VEESTLISLSTHTAATMREQLRQSHPAYYRAWSSMTTVNGVDSICAEWRGITGLMQFITDTSILDNSPSVRAGVKVLLKRLLPSLPFSPANVYWKLPEHVRMRELKSAKQNTPINVFELPASSSPAHSCTVDSIIQSYPTRESQEARMNDLFMKPFQEGGTPITPAEEAEMKVLDSLINSVPLEPSTKFTDI